MGNDIRSRYLDKYIGGCVDVKGWNCRHYTLGAQDEV